MDEDTYRRASLVITAAIAVTYGLFLGWTLYQDIRQQREAREFRDRMAGTMSGLERSRRVHDAFVTEVHGDYRETKEAAQIESMERRLEEPG